MILGVLLQLTNNRIDPTATKRIVNAIKFTARPMVDAPQMQNALMFTAKPVVDPCNVTSAIAFTAIKA